MKRTPVELLNRVCEHLQMQLVQEEYANGNTFEAWNICHHLRDIATQERWIAYSRQRINDSKAELARLLSH